MGISNIPEPFPSATSAWYHLTEKVLTKGLVASARGLSFYEIIGQQAKIDMTRPILSLKSRNLGYRFMAAEAAWIISGDNRVETIKPYSKFIEKFSDDGLFFAGAYGPMIRHQLPYIIRTLHHDQGTRQAVMTVWKPSPGLSKDIPCTISAQFICRGDMLHCVLNMRSSDLWLGAPYDWFNFSMLTAYVLLSMRMIEPTKWAKIVPGCLIYWAGSCHVYFENERGSINALQSSETWGDYKPFNINEFRTPQQLISHLWELADHHERYRHDFALEVLKWKE